MYVGVVAITYGNGPKPTTADAALVQIRAARGEIVKAWVDDVLDDVVTVKGKNRFGMEILELSKTGFFFWAKDKSTLFRGFAEHDAPLASSSQIAVFSGAYLGDTQAISRAREFGASWKFKSKFEEKRGKGTMTLADARNAINRRVLEQKGFFVFVADNAKLGQNAGGVRVMASGTQSLTSLRSFID